jgi:hypothetical protein
LASSQLDYAREQKFPKRYLKIIQTISAHSNDECHPSGKFSIIKTLPYQSKNASRFFRRLDICMMRDAEQDQKSCCCV